MLMIRRPPRTTRVPYTTRFRTLPQIALARAQRSPASSSSSQDIFIVPGMVLLGSTPNLLQYLRIAGPRDRKSTGLNSSHANISYAVFCLQIFEPAEAAGERGKS